MSPPGMRSVPPPTAALQDPQADLGGPGTAQEKSPSHSLSSPLHSISAATFGRELVGCFYGLNGAKRKEHRSFYFLSPQVPQSAF